MVPSTAMTDANASTVEAWNTVLFEKFIRFRHVVTRGLRSHGDAAIERHPPTVGSRVLDLGSGFGDTTQQLAEHVGPQGEVVGVDCAERFVRLAEKEATAAGRNNVRFLVADAQTDDLKGPYDSAFSRFGTMFFASAVAALRNIRRSLKPGGQLTMVCWRKREDNEFVHAAEVRVRAVVPARQGSGEPTCGPGPFSMADEERVKSYLLAAGFSHPTLDRFDADIRIGDDLSDAVECAMALGPAGEVLRLAGREAEALRPRVLQALNEALSPFLRQGGVFARSSSWIISARAA